MKISFQRGQLFLQLLHAVLADVRDPQVPEGQNVLRGMGFRHRDELRHGVAALRGLRKVLADNGQPRGQLAFLFHHACPPLRCQNSSTVWPS